MQAKLRKTRKLQWYRQLISLVLGCLLMASFADAETKPDDTLYDEWPELVGKWGPMMKLRDNTDAWDDGRKPAEGWWIGPIHATLLSDGKIIVTGLSRRDEKRVYFSGDQLHSAVENGISFVLDPDDIKRNPIDTLYVTPARENGEMPDGGPPGPGLRDVLFCSGHTPIGDGRVLFTGGSRMVNLAQDNQGPEAGLNYARLYNAKAKPTKEFSIIGKPGQKKGEVVPYRFKGEGRYNQMWYPTSIRLSNGKVLTFAGFYEGRYDRPYGFNLSLHLFDPKKLDNGQNPHSLLVKHENSVPYLKLSESDYAQMVLLPQPITIEGTTYQVAAIATSGHIVLINLDEPKKNPLGEVVPMKKRFHVLTQRPSGNCRYQSGRRATFLLSPTGKELVVIGGFKDDNLECDVSRRADFYHLEHRTWYSADLGIARPFPTATVLPTGVVLIANGGPIGAPAIGRQPPGELGTDVKTFPGVTHVQLLDPEIHYAYDLGAWSDDASARGYHGIALLMKDASVLIAGGASRDGPYGAGSERPDIRFYEPYYLHQKENTRPEWGDVKEPIAMTAGATQTIKIPYSGPELKEKGGVVLMALGSFTHHFDHNQRYIPLDYTRNGKTLEITPPASTSIAPKGDYILYLVGPSDLSTLEGEPAKLVRDFGMPSVGKHVVLK